MDKYRLQSAPCAPPEHPQAEVKGIGYQIEYPCTRRGGYRPGPEENACGATTYVLVCM